VSKRRAPKVRNLLAAIAGGLARKGYECEELVAILQKKHSKEIESEIVDILHIGLMRIAGQVSARRSAIGSSAQLELFREYRVPKMLTRTVEDERGIHRIHKAIGSMTIPEVREHVVEKSRPRVRRSREIDELNRMADDLEAYAKSATSTIDECWEEKKKTG
jgi:hypothetical protein